MEGKHQKINIFAILVFFAFVQVMLGGKVLGILGSCDGDTCFPFNPCCEGYHCNALIGVCTKDLGCLPNGYACGIWRQGFASCCDPYSCSNHWDGNCGSG